MLFEIHKRNFQTVLVFLFLSNYIRKYSKYRKGSHTLFGGDGDSVGVSPLNLRLFRIPAEGDADGEYIFGI